VECGVKFCGIVVEWRLEMLEKSDRATVSVTYETFLRNCSTGNSSRSHYFSCALSAEVSTFVLAIRGKNDDGPRKRRSEGGPGAVKV
jgi:hypothetical protein